MGSVGLDQDLLLGDEGVPSGEHSSVMGWINVLDLLTYFYFRRGDGFGPSGKPNGVDRLPM